MKALYWYKGVMSEVVEDCMENGVSLQHEAGKSSTCCGIKEDKQTHYSTKPGGVSNNAAVTLTCWPQNKANKFQKVLKARAGWSAGCRM
jgi:hypothetical protein